MSVITFTQKISRDLIKFDLNTDVSLANACRIILSELKQLDFILNHMKNLMLQLLKIPHHFIMSFVS